MLIGSYFNKDEQGAILPIANLDCQADSGECLHKALEASCRLWLCCSSPYYQLKNDRGLEMLTRIMKAIGYHIVHVKVSMQRIGGRCHDCKDLTMLRMLRRC